jgi:hypothetical protein
MDLQMPSIKIERYDVNRERKKAGEKEVVRG